MAGARNTEAASLDTTIGTLLTQFQAYRDVSVTGEPANAPADYFIRSMFTRLMADTDLKQILIQAGFATNHFKPIGLNEATGNTLVLFDPKAVA